MKKFIFSAIAAIGLLLSPSCSDENEALSGSGNEALVSFSVNLADGISTKAIGDGTKAGKLNVYVFEENVDGTVGSQITALRKSNQTVENKKADVIFNLVKGKTYNFLFWADEQGVDDSSNPFSISGDGIISVDYSKMTPNAENSDAFVATIQNLTVNGNFSVNVELKRPFAQLNFLTTEDDIEGALAANIISSGNLTSKMTISQAAKKLNPFTNTVSEPTAVTFNAKAVPVSVVDGEIQSIGNETYEIGGERYYYLSSNYFLVNAAGSAAGDAKKPATLASAKMEIVDAEGNGLTVTNIPVRMNYRTNIYGNLLTSQGKFKVQVISDFETPDNDVPRTVEVSSTSEISSKIALGAREITCTEAITSPVTISIPKVFENPASGADTYLSLKFTGDISSRVTFEYGTEANSEPKTVDIINEQGGGTWIIPLTESHVTLNGSAYETVIASTSASTLVISEGVTVTKSITANQGGVKILGKVLGEGLTGGAAAITMAEGAGNLEIQGEVNGSIQSNSTTTEVTITPTATVTGSVETKGNITVQGSVTGNVKSTGENTKVSIEETAQVGGNIDGDVALSPKADVDESKINSGSGSSNTFTTKIGTADELIILAAKVNAGTYASKAVELTKNINLNGVAWTPLIFSGDITINGNGHTIQGLDKALVGRTNGANITIYDLTIENSNISYLATDPNEANLNGLGTGGFISYQDYAGTVTFNNCHLKNSTVNGIERAAGLIGCLSLKNVEWINTINLRIVE